ncbi:MAG: hypothetical protein PHF86_03360 [Candidatus Nanoarchaeia archaeon]|nr:hypothetical protein [Candidatus Nanoarchaeia archaeon]
MKPVKHGAQCGCNDMAPPEKYTAEQLSRVRDLLMAAEKVEETAQSLLPTTVFRSLPEAMKLEFNYSNWKYVEVNHA